MMPHSKEGGSVSMYETLAKTVETTVDHEERISSLEENDERHAERLKKLEDNSIRMENTIMVENRDTRNTMKEQTEKLFSIVETAMSFQTTQVTQSHELKMVKWNTISTIFLKVSTALFGLLGSGGLIYVAIMKVFFE